MEKKKKTIISSTAIAVVLVLVGLLTGDVSILGNLMIIAVLVIVVPLFLFKYSTYLWTKSVENQFPKFVRDLADAQRSGMSFPQSIKLTARANYGKLSAEIHTMANKLAMGVPFLRVIELFGNRVQASRLITESLTIIKESYKAGGNVTATLDAIASDLVMLKETEQERVSMVKQQVMIIYGIFFMFLGIAVMIIFILVPMIQTQPNIQSGGGFGFLFSNPCQGVTIFPCNALDFVGLILGNKPAIASYYVNLFFLVVIIQGIFTGLIAGQVGENSAIAGSKHSMVMVIIGIGIFLFLSKAGFFPK